MPEDGPIQRCVEAGVPPATVASLARDLRHLGVAGGDVLLVHSSLSALGCVVGGGEAVVRALLEVLGPRGTLAMPAFSGDRGEPAPWRHPPVPEAWWPIYREHTPAFDPQTTPPRKMGVVAETFRTWPGTVRSLHPSCSVCARGPLAQRVVADHVLENGMGEGSPLARLYDLDARVLLLGVTHANDSSLHLAEHRARGIRLPVIEAGAALLVDGERRWVRYRDVDGDSDDFQALGEAFGREPGAERVGPVALATARLFSQRAIVDFGVRWLEVHRPA